MAGGAIKGEAWSPAGGWFFIPKNWKSNTIIVLGGLATVAAATLLVGNKLTYRSNNPDEDDTIERWNAAARKARAASAIKETSGSN